ncbi:hypothetical protein JTB14_019126 [Gonioctena quinquepunctata]|nr:hypothetical protein JTB14_019126 [Gonioctena quinquepunctata]
MTPAVSPIGINTIKERFSSSNAKKTLDRTTQNLDFDHLSQIPGPSKNEDTPVRDKVDLPLKTVTDVNRLEAYLANEKNLAALAAYSEILGGKDKVGKINTILRCLIFNQVAAQYSFLGTRNQKLPFGTLKLRKVVISAVFQI